jgi:hypothetical protein
MTLGLVAAGQALALDATRVVYDLSELQGESVSTPSPRGESQTLGLPMGNLPISTPSNGSTNDGFLQSGDDLEILGRRGNSGRSGQGVNAPRGGGSGGNTDREPQNDPTPNPEPGTLILVGSALAAGARRMRRRA